MNFLLFLMKFSVIRNTEARNKNKEYTKYKQIKYYGKTI